MIFSAIMWALVAWNVSADHVHEEAHKSMAEIGDIMLILVFAMLDIEMVAHHNAFKILGFYVQRSAKTVIGLFITVMVATAITSAFFDNMTTALVMTRLMGGILGGVNMLIFGVGIAGAANIGGAPSVMGDVTSIMIWRSGKITALGLLMYAGPAAIGNLVTFIWRMKGKLNPDEGYIGEPVKPDTTPFDYVMIIIGVVGFSFILLFSLMGLPPFMGLMLAVGVMITIMSFRHKEHASNVIEHILQKVDLLSIALLVGLLAMVFALRAAGILEWIAINVLGENPSFAVLTIFSVVMGLFSAVVDNVPLTAVAIELIETHDPMIWGLLAYCVGTGGMIFVIGTVASIVMAGQIDMMKHLPAKMTFGKYIQIGSGPALTSYFAGIAVWLIQVVIVRGWPF